MSSVVRVEPLTTARVLRGPFDYRRPDDSVGVGSRLLVPFGRQKLAAVVTSLASESEHELSDPLRVVEPSLPPELVELAMWLAREYCSTPARALSLMLPPSGTSPKTALYALPARAPAHDERLNETQRALLASLPRFTGADTAALRRLEGRELVTIEPRVVRRAPVHVEVGAVRAKPQLTGEQEEALAQIAAAAPGDKLLLHGVTGSGKTEVYLRAAERVLAAGGSVIVLVPEIGLTPQIVSRFVARFGDTVAVLHSKMGAGERHDEWLRLRRGEARVAVGPRSAVFAPCSDVGLVIVDEEHDSSYKHEGDPRYDARLVAEQRARDGVLVCGSATPRPESVHALKRIRLLKRVDGAPLPAVRLVDMRRTDGALHPQTFEALVSTRKAIVMLNRRGWSNFLNCRTCGHAWGCPNCDVSLVLHRAENVLSCHHCGHRERVPDRCVACGSISIGRHGLGTERLADDLAQTGRPVFRLDADVRHAAGVLSAFEQADRGILVGTQMVAKGHDFPDVGLGVVLDADGTLRFPDFRSEERTFALVTQLAGRAGRGSGSRGEVLVQTLAPEADAIRLAAAHDADRFIRGELDRREALRYPPFSTLIRVVCGSEQPGAAIAAARAVRERLDAVALGDVLGPAPLFRLRGRERAQVVVKAQDRRGATDAVGEAVARVAAAKEHRPASFSVDVDPQ